MSRLRGQIFSLNLSTEEVWLDELLVFFSTQNCVYVSWNTRLWKWNCYFKTYFNPICVLALAGPVQRNANSFFALGKTIKMVRAHYFQNIILFEVRVRSEKAQFFMPKGNCSCRNIVLITVFSTATKDLLFIILEYSIQNKMVYA